MARSVVLQGTERCDGCRLPPRWCVCGGLESVALPLAVDVLQHRGEGWKPTSTGHLLARIVTGSRIHRWDAREPFDPARDLARPGLETWVLHPKGEPWPEEPPVHAQLVLLDGTWSQANEMLRALGGFGRRVALRPPAAPSRFWLRTQHDVGNVSTLEALLLAVDAMGRRDERDRLEALFELHVYASLRARGKKELAAQYLLTSPVEEALRLRLAQAGLGA